MARGRSITFKYKRFEQNDYLKNLLNIDFNEKDEIEVEKLYNNYKALGVRRGYEYIIKDLYILVSKRELSSADIADIYEVGVRTVQLWLKELGLNRDQKEAVKMAVKKRSLQPKINTRSKGDKSIPRKLSTVDAAVAADINIEENKDYIYAQSPSCLNEDFIVELTLELKKQSKLKKCEIIISPTSLGIFHATVESAVDVSEKVLDVNIGSTITAGNNLNCLPIVIIKESKVFKFLLPVGNFNDEILENLQKQLIKEKIKGYTLLSQTKPAVHEDYMKSITRNIMLLF